MYAGDIHRTPIPFSLFSFRPIRLALHDHIPRHRALVLSMTSHSSPCCRNLGDESTTSGPGFPSQPNPQHGITCYSKVGLRCWARRTQSFCKAQFATYMLTTRMRHLPLAKLCSQIYDFSQFHLHYILIHHSYQPIYPTPNPNSSTTFSA